MRRCVYEVTCRLCDGLKRQKWQVPAGPMINHRLVFSEIRQFIIMCTRALRVFFFSSSPQYFKINDDGDDLGAFVSEAAAVAAASTVCDGRTVWL